MDLHDSKDVGILGLVAEGEGDPEAIYTQLRNELGLNRDFNYMKCVSTIIRFKNKNYIERTSYAGLPSNTTSNHIPAGSYSITQKGQIHLQSLLRLPIEKVANPTKQSQLLLKVRFLHHLPETEQTEELARMEDQVVQARNKLIDNDNRRQTNNQEYGKYHQTTSDIRILTLDNYVDKIENLRNSISLDD